MTDLLDPVYDRDNYFYLRRSRTPWIPLEKPLPPIRSYPLLAALDALATVARWAWGAARRAAADLRWDRRAPSQPPSEAGPDAPAQH